MMNRVLVLLAGVLMAGSVMAAPAPVVPSSFAKPPAAALKALRATVGKPIPTGFVFVDGRYLAPPYKVERYGNVIRINGTQVTGELISWNEFIKTQTGVTTTRSESAAEPSPAPEPEPEPEEEVEDDTESSLDDLFDDDPAPKKPVAKKKKPVSRPRLAKPTVTVSYSFDGEFEPNEKTKLYVEKMNTVRMRIDKHLRAGGYYCFGSRYSAVTGDKGAAKLMFDKLPELMRDGASQSQDAFITSAQAAGLSFLPRLVLADLHRNRYTYHELMSRRKSMQEEAKWSAILNSGR